MRSNASTNSSGSSEQILVGSQTVGREKSLAKSELDDDFARLLKTLGKKS